MPAAPLVVAAVIAVAAITTQIGLFLTHKCEFDCLGYGYLREGHRGKQILLSPTDVDAIESDFDILTRPNATLAAAIGRDYGDQSKGFDVDPADFELVNVNNPGRHLPGFSDNALTRLTDEWASRRGLTRDYEQLLEKRPRATAAAFPWHQDMQYWPKRSGASTRTVTFSLALTDADADAGCLQVIPGSGTAQQLLSDRGAAASGGSNERAIELPLTEAELGSARPVPVKRGQVTMHDEWIVHGSGGNAKATPRKTYVVAYRDAKMVEYERSIGFSHSYNDDPEVLRKVRAGEL